MLDGLNHALSSSSHVLQVVYCKINYILKWTATYDTTVMRYTAQAQSVGHLQDGVIVRFCVCAISSGFRALGPKIVFMDYELLMC